MPRPRKRRGKPINGWLLIDKPTDWTSSDVVNKVKRHLDAQKAGHGGTLDPLATGLLAIAFGEATKTVGYALHGPKTYSFNLQFGRSTTTDDAEGETLHTSDVIPDEAAIRAILPQFLGVVMQRPPIFSAIKVDGQRAYDMARNGESVDLPEREVECHGIEFEGFVTPTEARFTVDCGPGYYVRSLARDLAEKLGSVGHVSALRRDRVAALDIDDAVTLDKFLALPPEDAIATLRPIQAVLDDIPAFAVSADEAQGLRQGQPVRLLKRQDRSRIIDLGLEDGDPDATVLITTEGQAVALATLDGPELKPLRIFNL